MAPRAYWKGYLKLSLVSCPIALYPATSSAERVSFLTRPKVACLNGRGLSGFTWRCLRPSGWGAGRCL